MRRCDLGCRFAFSPSPDPAGRIVHLIWALNRSWRFANIASTNHRGFDFGPPRGGPNGDVAEFWLCHGITNAARLFRPRLNHFAQRLGRLDSVFIFGCKTTALKEGVAVRRRTTDLCTLMADLCLEPLLFFLVGSHQDRVVPKDIGVINPLCDGVLTKVRRF